MLHIRQPCSLPEDDCWEALQIPRQPLELTAPGFAWRSSAQGSLLPATPHSMMSFLAVQALLS